MVKLLKQYVQSTNLQHAISYMGHFFEGIHKFEDPVSNTTLKSCDGFPI